MRRLRIGLTATIAILAMSFTLVSNTRLLSHTPLARDTYIGCFEEVTIITDDDGYIYNPQYKEPPGGNKDCYSIIEVFEGYPPYGHPPGPVPVITYAFPGTCNPVSPNICCYEVSFVKALSDYAVTGVCYGEFVPDDE